MSTELKRRIDLNQFIDWVEERPQTRMVNIEINNCARSKDLSVWVYDYELRAGQIVESVEEIDLLARKCEFLEQEIEDARRLGVDI